MELLYMFLIINIVSGETCREFKVHKIAYQNKRLINDHDIITCLLDISLDQCALECLLVKMCKSLNYVSYREDVKGSVCELNDLNHMDPNYLHGLEHKDKYVYVDVRDWPKEVAGTCASTPCEANQRCIPTTPYRCIDVDCGIPPVAPLSDYNTDMYPLTSNTSLGSKVYYECHDKSSKIVVLKYAKEVSCINGKHYSLCNSNFSWATSLIGCLPRIEGNPEEEGEGQNVKQRTYFTPAERKTLETAFKKHIKLEKVPGKLDAVNFVQKNPTFSRYPWTKIKYAVHNMIHAKKLKTYTNDI